MRPLFHLSLILHTHFDHSGVKCQLLTGKQVGHLFPAHLSVSADKGVGPLVVGPFHPNPQWLSNNGQHDITRVKNTVFLFTHFLVPFSFDISFDIFTIQAKKMPTRTETRCGLQYSWGRVWKKVQP